MKKLLLILSMFTFLVLNDLYAQKSKCMDYGIGTGGDYYMFNDFFKFGTPWTPYRYVNGGLAPDAIRTNYHVDNDDDYKLVNGAYWTYDTDFNGSINNDTYINYLDMMVDQGKVLPSGYPVSIPLTIYQYKSKKIDPNQGADSTKPIIIGNVTRLFASFPLDVPTGPWVLKWKGKGKFVFDGVAAIVNTSANITVNSQGGSTYDFNSQAGGRVELNYAPIAGARYLRIESSDASDPIRDIQFIFPGKEAEVDANRMINTLFTDKVKQYKTIRYMDYMQSNGVPQRPFVMENHKYYKSNYLEPLKWDERAKQGGITANAVHENIIDISNITKTCPWVNIPYCAGQDYVEKMMKLYLDNLDPGLTLYLEIGNELWNSGGGFEGYRWMDKFNTYSNTGLNSYSGMGTRINVLYKWITTALGPNIDRVVRVVGTQTEYLAVTDYICAQIDPSNWDAVAYAWYFNADKKSLYEYWQTNPSQTEFNQKYQDGHLLRLRTYYYNVWKGQADKAKGYGKKFITYEGGTGSLSGNNNGPNGEHLSNPEEFQVGGPAIYPQYLTDNGFIYMMAEADKSSASAVIFNEVLDSMQALGTQLASHYGFAGMTTAWGIWNLFPNSDEDETLDFLNAKYPKFQTFNDRLKKDNCSDIFVNLPADSIGPGLSMKLDGINDYVQLDNNKPVETSNYSLEAWIKSDLQNVKGYVFSLTNSVQADNNNAVYIREDGKLIWEINSAGRQMKIVGSTLLQNKWYHVAVTKSGQRYTLYINGSRIEANSDVAAGSKDRFSLGTLVSETTLSFPFKGEVDECRIWNVARSEEDIRDFMCKKIPQASLPSSLIAYLRFDDGNRIVNVTNISTGSKPGLLKNIGFSEYSGYTVSGAAIGDESKYSYQSSWTGVTVSFSHSEGDNIGVNNIGAGSPDGIQIYWINEGPYYKFVPDHYEKIATNKYFGVFMANGTDPTYDLSYMYQGNPGAGSGAEEDKNRLLRKDDGSVADWKHSGAKLDKVAHRLNLLCKEKNRGEYNIGFRQDNKVVRPGSGMALQYDTSFVDGNEIIITQTLPTFNDYTVTFWARGSGFFIDLYGTSGALGYQQNNDNISITYYGGFDLGYSGLNGSGHITSPSIGGLDSWNHYAVVRKGTHLTIYANGNNAGEKDFPDIAIYNRMSILSNPGWVGSVGCHIAIDELTLWNTELDQKTIRDWMCKKITNEHPYSCKNLLLYFNFDEGAGNILEDKNGPGDIEITPGYFTYIPSGAAIGDESAYDYDTPEELSFATSQGDFLQATRTSGASKGIHLYRVDNMAPVKNKVNDASILALDSSRYWGMFVCYSPGGNPVYDLTYHYQGNSTVKDDSKLRMLDRYNNADPIWTNPSSQIANTIAKTIKLPSQLRGEYVLGGDKGTFIFKSPAAPVFLSETSILNNKALCGNSKGLVYRVQKDPLAVSYNWILPAELDGFSNKDSIILSASYTGSNSITVTLSVVAINSYGKSVRSDYQITINPAPTKANAGPDQIILPPNSSAIMDGNIVSSNETGTWSIGKGNGTITTATNPKTNITNLQSGVDFFVWTIKSNSSTCPSSVDTVKIIFGPPPINITLADDSPLPPFICGGTMVTLKAVPAEGVVPNGYTWEIPQGFRLISSSGNTVIVESSDQGVGGTFKIKALYGQDNAESQAYESSIVSIEGQPKKPVFTEFPNGLCLEVATNVSAALDPTANAYEWTLPDGIKTNAYPLSTSNSATIRGWKTVSGFIKLQAFHNGCTNSEAADSFFVEVKTAPAKPLVAIVKGDGYPAVYCNDDAIYSIVNPDPNLDYVWVWDDRMAKLIEYFGQNRYAAHFDRTLTDQSNGILVYATNKSNSCNASEAFVINGWWRPNTGNKPDSIKITSPVGQDLSALQVGQTYDLTTSCSTCPRTIQEGEPIFQDKYYWDAPKGISIIDDGNAYDNNVKIRVDSSVSGPVRAWAITLKGCVGGADSLNVSTPDGLAAPIYISGNTTICSGTNLTINVKNVEADEYIWQLPNGTAPISTSVPILNEPTTKGMSGDITVKARKGTIFSSIAKISILVKSTVLPATTFFDVGKNPITNYEVCLGERYDKIYVKDNYAKEYVWYIDQPQGILQFEPFRGNYDINENGKIDTIPGDGNEYQITNPRTTLRDTLNTFNNSSGVNGNGSTSGYIYILSKNGCGGSNRVDSLHYELATSAHVQLPVFIDAPTKVCVGSKVTYKINELKSIDQYIWTVPNGLNVNELITTLPQITVDVVNGSGGKITVYGISKVCGGGSTTIQQTEMISIQGAPIDFHFIDAPLSGCLGDTLKFKVNDVGAVKYTWNLPGGLANTVIDDSDPNVKIINGVVRGFGLNQWQVEYVDGLVNGENRISQNRLEHEDTLIYNFTVKRSGWYNVSLSYRPIWFDASNNIPIEVYSKAGMSKLFIDETKGSSAFLGKFEFEEGKPAMVKVYTYQDNTNVRADAITLVSLGFDAGTEMSFVASAKESGSVCVTIPSASCPAGYTICTDNINLSEELKEPSISVEANSVCEGKVYKYSVTDIGADSYSWILPAGWKIGTEGDTVKGQGRTVEVIAGPSSGKAVKIGVLGTLKCGNQKSTIAYTKDINYSNSCKLSAPVFSSETSSLCEGNAFVYSISPVSGATSYEWTLPSGLSRSSDNQTGIVITSDNSISVVGTGLGTKGYIKVKAKSLALGSSDEDSTSKAIKVVDGLSAGSDATIGVCASEIPVDLFAKLGGKPDAGGNWTDLDNSNAMNNGIFDPSKTVAGKSYRFNYVVIPKGCSNDTAMLTVNVGNKILSNITYTGSTILCEGDSLKLSSGALTGNQWYKHGQVISGATGKDYQAKSTGNYNVVSTSAGCSSDSTGKAVAINANPKPDGIINVTGSTSFCPEGSVTLSSAYPTGNQWYKDGQVMSSETNPELTVNAEGYYNLIVTLGSCFSDSSRKGKSVKIKANPPSEITAIGNTNICIGDSVVLSSGSDIGNQWYKNGQIISGATNKNYTATSSGTYNLKFTLSGGCVSDSSASAKVITINPKPVTTITASSNSFCEGSTVVLSSDAQSGNQWFKDGAILPGDTNQNYTVTMAGNYNVVVTEGTCVSDTLNNGKQLKIISANKSLAITSSDVCPGLDGKVTIEKSETGVRYDVFVNSDSVGTANGTGANLNINIPNESLKQANNKVSIMATARSCTKINMDKTVYVAITNIEKDLLVTGGTNCYNEDGTVTISNSQAGVSYEPYINNILAGASVKSAGGSLEVSVSKTLLSKNGNVVTIKASGFGCNPQILTNTGGISVKPEIQKPGPISGPSEICKADEVVYSVATEAGKTYVWGFPLVADSVNFINTDPSEATVKLQFKDSIHGKDFVTVKIKEGSCYSDTSRLVVKTKANCNDIFIPNIITPDNTSDKNNIWVIEGIQNYPNAEIKIMNRWGSLVYQSKGYTKAWDGSSKNNDPLPTGTYYYIIDLKDKGTNNHKNTTFNGSVTIMR